MEAGRRGLMALVLSLPAALWAGQPAMAEDFRIHTQLFVEGEDTPVSENTTLFKSGLVYDFRGSPEEITVFDPPRSRFILLDVQRKLRTEVGVVELDRFVLRLKHWAAGHNDPFLKFQAEPEFQIVEDRDDTLVFTSKYTTYRVTGAKAASEEGARQYGEFSDWYARLNTMTTATLLPFARLQVNEALKKRQWVPTEVHLRVTQAGAVPGTRSELALRTTHRTVWGLSAADLKRIDEAGEHLSAFKVVKFEEFRAKPDQEKK